jgi:predicted nucleotidyltransferase
MNRDDALAFLARHVPVAFAGADTALLCGSTSRDQAKSTSDVDVVVLFEALPDGAWRLTEEYDGTQIEAFVHDLGTLRYFFEEFDAKSGSKTLANMVAEGIPVLGLPNRVAAAAKDIARAHITAGPPALGTETIERRRFLIGSFLDDLKDDSPRHEHLATAATLYIQLAEFILRAAGKFSGQGKGLARDLEAHDPALAAQIDAAFATFFRSGDTSLLDAAVAEALAPNGGRIGPRYFAKAPAAWRKD